MKSDLGFLLDGLNAIYFSDFGIDTKKDGDVCISSSSTRCVDCVDGEGAGGCVAPYQRNVSVSDESVHGFSTTIELSCVLSCLFRLINFLVLHFTWDILIFTKKIAHICSFVLKIISILLFGCYIEKRLTRNCPEILKLVHNIITQQEHLSKNRKEHNTS